MRELISKYGVPAIVVLILVALIIAYASLRTPSPSSGNPDLAFYIDEETGDETTGPSSQFPPLPGKSGKPTVVQEIKMSFDGGRTSQPFYYLKYTDEAKEKLDAPFDPRNPGERPDILDKGRLVRAAKPDSTWVSAMSDAGNAVTTLPIGPNGKQAMIVDPRK